MKRLLHIVDSLEPGDVPEQLRLLAHGLPRNEFDLHVCAFRGGPVTRELQAAGVPVRILPQRLPFDPALLVRLKQHMAALRPDLVQTWLFSANTHGRIAAQAAGIGRLVAVERNLDLGKRWPQWQLDRRLARYTTRIVAPSPVVQEFYEAHDVRPDRYAIIPDGVACPLARPNMRVELLEELELPSTTCLIGVCAPLRPESRIKDLVWALDILKWVYGHLHLVILGAGPQQRALMRYVDCVELSTSVHFLGPRSEAAEILAGCDYFWHAAGRDGAAQALLQAMAAGVPSVAVDTPLHRLLIAPGETGLLAAPKDRPALARATHCLLTDATLRQTIGQSAAARVQAEFSPETMVARYRALYAEVL